MAGELALFDEIVKFGNPWHGRFARAGSTFDTTTSTLTLGDGHVLGWPSPTSGFTWLTAFPGVPAPVNDAGDIAAHRLWRNSAIFFGEEKWYSPTPAGPAAPLGRDTWLYRAPGGAIWKMECAFGASVPVGIGASQTIHLTASRNGETHDVAGGAIGVIQSAWVPIGPDSPLMMVNHSATGEVATCELKFLKTQFLPASVAGFFGIPHTSFALNALAAQYPWLFLNELRNTSNGLEFSISGGSDTVPPSALVSSRGFDFLHVLLTCGPSGVCHYTLTTIGDATWLAINGVPVHEHVPIAGHPAKFMPLSNNVVGEVYASAGICRLLSPFGTVTDVSSAYFTGPLVGLSMASLDPLSDTAIFGYGACHV